MTTDTRAAERHNLRLAFLHLITGNPRGTHAHLYRWRAIRRAHRLTRQRQAT